MDNDLLIIAAAYRDLWMICHENTPREPKVGENLELGHLRGRLFAAIDRALSPRETDDDGICPSFKQLSREEREAHPAGPAASAPSGEVAEMMAGTIPTDAPDRWEVSIHIGDDGDWHLRHRKSQTGQWVTFEEHQKVIASLRRPESTKGVADISGMQQKPRVLNKNER